MFNKHETSDMKHQTVILLLR